MEWSGNMEYRGFSSDWCSYFVEIPWITQEGLTRCNAVRSGSLLLSYHFSTDQSVFYDLQEFFQVRFQTSKFTGFDTCNLSIDVNHNVYSNNCSLLSFRRFLAENIFSINLKFIFQDGLSGIMEYYQWWIVPFWCIICNWLVFN